MNTATAPIAAPVVSHVAGETVTPVATPATDKPKAKRGRGAAGNNVFLSTDLETAKADAKTRGEKYNVFTISKEGIPTRYYVSNHRNAVQFAVMTADGYGIISGDGQRKGRKPADPSKTATEALDKMDDATRAAILAKYLGNGNAAAAVKEMPPAAPRVDTTPASEFDAAKGATRQPTPAPTSAQSATKGNAATGNRKR